MRSPYIFYLSIIFLLSTATYSHGQCDFNIDLEIEDESSFTIDFLVSGAEDNALGIDNCLKIVTTHFDHQFVSDVSIELESPSGDIVQLIGAPTDGNSTDLVNSWDVQFVNRDELTAMPDLDYDDVWNSIPPGGWVVFTTYTGSYYPYQGGLENYTGSINGVWKLHVSDESLFGSGFFSCFGMEFCNDENITIATCSPSANTIVEADFGACEGSEELDFLINPNVELEYDSTVYTYQYLLFESGFQNLTLETDFSSASPGNYTICGIHYLLDDSNELESIPVGSSQDEVEAYLMDQDVCYVISDNCVEIEIYDEPEVITQESILCKGDTITIGNDKYFETGIYEIVSIVSPCDSVSFLDLSVIDVEVDLSSNALEFSCLVTAINLSSEQTEIPTGATFQWTSVDGEFITSPNNRDVEIGSAGTYIFEVETEGCLFSEELIITENDDYVIFEITAEDITCLSDSAYVEVISSDSIIDISWVGPDTFRVDGNNILTSVPGLYMVDFVTEFGCLITQEIEVEDVREFPDFELEGDVITCINPTITISTNPQDPFNSSFTWVQDNDTIGSNKTLDVNVPGKYDLKVITEEGCIDSFSIEILSTKDTINVELFGGEIGCDNDEHIIGYSSSFSKLSALWTLPDGDPVVDSTFVSDQVGLYGLFLEDSNSCTLDTFLNVVVNMITPEILVDDLNFICGQDSLQVTSTIDMTNVSYEWTSSSGFRDTSSVPWVFAPGEYIVEVCLENGCCDIDTFMIGVDTDLPNIDFEFSEINCDMDTTYIIPSDTSSYAMDWFFEGVALTVDSNIIQVVDTGLYEVMVTNPANGCSLNYSFDIKENKVSTIDELFVSTLNCQDRTVQINVETDQVFDTYTWSGPGVLDNNEEPFVEKAGVYYLDYTFTNGCTGIDSIEVISEGEFPNLMAEDTVYNCFSPTLDLLVTYESNSINIIWEGPNFTGEGEAVTISEPGIYDVFAVAPGQCRDTISINVEADTISPVISISNDGIITCDNTSVDLDLVIDANTTSYVFNGPGIISQNMTNIEVDQGGIYTAIGMADNGCSSTVTNEVLVSNEPPVYEISLDTLNCVTETVSVGFSSPDLLLSVDWDGPMNVADNTYNFTTNEAGTYSFVLTNSDGCQSEDSFVLLLDTLPPSGFINLSNQITCADEDVNLTIGNYDSTWNVTWTGNGIVDPKDIDITTDEVGEYTLELIGTNGCIMLDTVEVIYDTLPPVIDVIGDPITCVVAKVILNVDTDVPLVDYQWEGPNSYISTEEEPLVAESGEYKVTVTSENGCVSVGTIDIDDERVFPDIEIEDYFLPCDGAPAIVAPTIISEGATIKWFGPNNYFVENDTATILIEGEYVGIAFSEEGCLTADTFLIINDAIPPVFSATTETLFCFGPIEIAAIDVDDDRSLLWEGPEGFQSEDAITLTEIPGAYTLTVIGENGCPGELVVEVEDGRIYPDANAQNEDLFQCENTTINLSGNGSSEGTEFTYQWSTEDGVILSGGQTLAPLIQGEGNYVIEVTNNTIGCISYDTLDLTMQEQDLRGVELLITPPTCMGFENGIIEITQFNGGYGPFDIVLDDNQYGERTELEYLDVGEHMLTITDSLGCVIDSLVVIDTSNLLSVTLPFDTTLILGQSINVIADINLPDDSISQILWSDNVPCVDCRTFELLPNNNMTISVLVTDVNGCVEEREFRITVNRPDKLPFPQIFSPNGDGVNDIFYMPMVTGIQSIEYIRVYDNWGGLVHQSLNPILGDPSFGWDGTLNGRNAEIAVYLVESVVVLVDGTSVRYVGDVTLVR